MSRFASLFADIDLPHRFRRVLPPLVTQYIVANICLVGGLFIRLGLNAISPGAAPFALIFPMVMLATLFAGLASGLMVALPALLFGWYFAVPVRGSFTFADAVGPSTLVVMVITTGLTLAVAQTFREAVRRAQRDRDQQIADRDLYLREFDHRVKNNFAIVISLLELQRRRADTATAAALSVALMRVEGISRAHQHLYRGSGHQPGTVEISSYLEGLCAALGDALSLARGIVIRCESDVAPVARDRAVSIGLIVNELVTNAAKHAFPDRDEGRIDVGCRVVPDGLRVTVADNGQGIRLQKMANDRRIGLGTRLVDAFARQANGKVTVESDDTGTRVTLDLAA